MHYLGTTALSAFRQKQLLQRIRARSPEVDDITVQWVYLLDVDGELPQDQEIECRQILGAESSLGQIHPDAIVVVPRLGTISPWSSKATDILRVCENTRVRRVERGRLIQAYQGEKTLDTSAFSADLHDAMTETVLTLQSDFPRVFASTSPRDIQRVALEHDANAALNAANQKMGLALSDDEVSYLADAYEQLGRSPSDAELMMFAQANSEHCRHKIFNAQWQVDGVEQDASLFAFIKASKKASDHGILSAYSDNAAVIAGNPANRFWVDQDSGLYRWSEERAEILCKVETHNHPTAIAPFAGAATGSGGEIRDEAATGRGAKPKAGLCGFTVSNLHIPDYTRSWEVDHGKPERIASALDIMREGPIGAAGYNNEFGRPALAGYFRTFELTHQGALRGYHKPIMIAGGMGTVRPEHALKGILSPGDKVVVLGGPSMLIGLGGGAASSMSSQDAREELDFASVQRDNPEMQRRCQEVIDRCWALGKNNPIVSIHDVGAGGLSNAIPEILHDSNLGGNLELREIPVADSGLSPMEIWSNESQERYVLGISPQYLDQFEAICRRERCPYAVVGEATKAQHLVLNDRLLDQRVVDLPMEVLFGNPPKMHRQARRPNSNPQTENHVPESLQLACADVLRIPSVASKQFLITIGDRSITGLVAQDQMIGPWQTPVANCAVTANDYVGYAGEAMSMGERPALALLDGPASGRMAVGEAVTNLLGTGIQRISDIKLSANWMAATGCETEEAILFDTVRTVGAEYCPALGIAIPVGKDSLSMQTRWQQDGEEKNMRAPVSLVVSAFSPVPDVRKNVTPMLDTSCDNSYLVLIDLGMGKNRLGASAYLQTRNTVGDVPPDSDPEVLKTAFVTIQRLVADGVLLALHDRSDGGLYTTLTEMAFAGRCGFSVSLEGLGELPHEILFAEELGCVIQVAEESVEQVLDAFANTALANHVHKLGTVSKSPQLRFSMGAEVLLEQSTHEMLKIWSETSYAISALRDNPETARQEYEQLSNLDDPGLSPELTFTPVQIESPRNVSTGGRPRIAILREQGVNGQIEMAAAFDLAGFDCRDVHMSDLISGSTLLNEYQGLVACGGFSYGDVLGAGQGWARSILHHDNLRRQFESFFHDTSKFALGVCNGCQMMSTLRDIIPGADFWPRFVRNRSEQFEARFSQVCIPTDSNSVFFSGMGGSRIPVAVAHGEGRAVFDHAEQMEKARQHHAIALQFATAHEAGVETYPQNPNGSPQGITGLSNSDGRITVMMPHPERVFRVSQMSWAPKQWQGSSPWMQMFLNARRWLQ